MQIEYIGHNFVKWLTVELKGVWTIGCNLEPPMVFVEVIIPMAENL